MTEIVDIDHAQEIDAFVRAHEKCHFEQTSSWGRVKNYDGWAGIICRDESGAIKGVMCVLISKINHTNMTRLYSPRGPLFDENDFDTFRELIEAAKALAKKHNAMVLKIDPMILNENKDFLKLTADMDLSLFFGAEGAAGYGLDAASSVAQTFFAWRAGDVDTSTFSQVFLQEQPMVPLCFRSGRLYCAKELQMEGEVNENDLYGNLYTWAYQS